MRLLSILFFYTLFGDLFKDITISIIIGLGSFILGHLPITYRNIKTRKLRKFVGHSSKNGHSIIVTVPIFHPKDCLTDGSNNNRYKKQNLDNDESYFPGPENVMADNDVSASSFVITMLNPISKEIIIPQNDEKTLDIWQNHSIFCIGSPVSNMKTRLLFDQINEMNDPLKKLPIQWKEAPDDLYKVRLINTADNQEYISTKDLDYGLILKISNPFSPRDFIFVTAGIAEFGTLASSQYLKNNWEYLYKESKCKSFFCVVSVNPHHTQIINKVSFKVIDF
ncbi:MAG: hypothetical protein GF353_08450 [Candidatus Lokiarchaeota archaeon]|nr:hypothetical protein [Candidatus Lokiarchaeota archaeon]